MNRENKLNFLQPTFLANYISNYCSMIAKCCKDIIGVKMLKYKNI